MTLTAADQKRIIDQESAWIDSDQFAPLDLRAFPSLTDLPPEDKHDDRFAKHWNDAPFAASARALREFVANPDEETLERVGEETGNPDLLADVADQRAEAVVFAFKKSRPDYLPVPQNFSKMTQTLAYNSNLTTSEQAGDPNDVADLLIQRGYWTVQNLQAVFDALDREGLLIKAAGEPRNLTERERLRVSRMAQGGQLDSAIGEFLRCSLDGDEPTFELLHDPRYRDLCDTATWFVWEVTTEDYVPTPAREAFIRRHCGNRPITIPLLNAAWAELKKREASRERGELLNSFQRPQEPEPMSVKEIDALDDTAVDRLYHDSLREYAASVRRAPGVLA